MPKNRKKKRSIETPGLEDALAEHSLPSSAEFVEVSLGKLPFLAVAFIFLCLAILAGGRLWQLGVAKGGFYQDRAAVNASDIKKTPAPRGIIYDRNGVVLANNEPVFSALLNLEEFITQKHERQRVYIFAEESFGISREELKAKVKEAVEQEVLEPIVLAHNITQDQVVQLKTSNLHALQLSQGFRRKYADREAFSSVLGYVGLPTREELARGVALLSQSQVGKAGIEESFNVELRGVPGEKVKVHDALGSVLHQEITKDPTVGGDLHLSIDAGLQQKFYEVMQSALGALGRTSGAGVAINPQNGEVLALLSFPTFDAEVLSSSLSEQEASAQGDPAKQQILQNPNMPLFNRAVSGRYSPGSTIKPLHGVAALAEDIITPRETIFSPGYLEVQNPYHPNQPSRFLDWQYQGYVDLSSALAKSSNVYFYTVGGGLPAQTETAERAGLGVQKIRKWWKHFGLGEKTGIELSGEAKGLLPSPEWKEEHKGTIWRLGDTYNISIGQGDLLLTPLQLIRYIGAIANGGVLYRPTLLSRTDGDAQEDLRQFSYEIEEVQKGMREAVISPEGTARTLANLPMAVAGKTGSAQVANNTRENAFFVGYGPYENPEIAVLVLVENSREGSLNAVPIAKEIFSWWHENRIMNKE